MKKKKFGGGRGGGGVRVSEFFYKESFGTIQKGKNSYVCGTFSQMFSQGEELYKHFASVRILMY